MKKILTLILIIVSLTKIIGQEKKIPQDPQDAKFETSDIQNFWKAFDAINNSNGNPFETYIKNGTIGLQGFIPNRIISADSLLIMVNRRKQDYEKIRGIEIKIKEQEKRIKPYFYALEYWYPYAVYPPVYFVVGRFNSGGTLSENGLLIGTEKLTSLDYLPELVIHESIHFQQKNPEGGETNLLQQSILEGMADFIAELVTGIKGNQEANKYGNEHKEELCREFVEKMYGNDIQDWLYGTSGKDNRPNDLGYWIGYEIVKAYFEKSDDKKLAVNHILNIEDYDRFLRDSGYLEKYMKLSNVGQKQMSYKIETSDIANFWVAFDSIKRSDNKAEVFRKLYLEKASDLFKKMISMSGDIRNPENYLESFEKYPKFWESLRKPTMALQNISLDIESCFEKVKSIYPKFKNSNVIVNLNTLKPISLEQIIEFLRISNQHRAAKHSFVIVNEGIDVDKTPEEIVIVPTLQEAYDIIEMEEMERDLGF